MKKLLLSLLLIGLTTYAQELEEKVLRDQSLLTNFTVNAPSEQETLDFLNSALAAYGADMAFPGSKTKIQISTKIDSRSNKKVIQIYFYTTSGIFHTQTVHPEHVNAVIEERAPNGNLCLSMISPDGLVLKQYAGDKDVTFHNEVRFPLAISDEEVRRIRKGLLHLLKLNNATFLNQELFKDKNE
jgi:hypothetical protein